MSESFVLFISYIVKVSKIVLKLRKTKKGEVR